MKTILGWACIAVLTALAVTLPAASTKKKSTSKTKTASSSSKSKKSSSKSGSKKAVASKRGKKGTTTRTTWRNRQLAPTPDRYKEIQEALATKGYLNAEDATGAWGQNSTDALKKFQADQHLDPTGKINSLSLIALGLGPKRESAPNAKPPDTPIRTTDH